MSASCCRPPSRGRRRQPCSDSSNRVALAGIEATRHNYPLNPTDDWALHETYEYAGAGGQLSQKTLQQRFPLEAVVADRYGQTFAQTWTYDALGNVATVGYPLCITTPQNGRQFCNDPADFQAPAQTATTTYTYGMPIKVQASLGALWAEYDYHPNLQISQVTAANGVVSLFDEGTNGMSRPRRIRHSLGATTHHDSGTYAYDGAGNIRAIGSDTYVYDQANRLLSGTVLAAGAGKREDYYT